jgi:hypothetical protein
VTDPGNDIPTIGICAGCQKRAVLKHGACEVCIALHGPKCGKMMSRIRKDREFAKMCYTQLNNAQRANFIKMFGNPYACIQC